MDRYYDPSTDQFLSVDPDLAETGQAYAFTGDDPLNATDPLGLKCKKGHTCPTKAKPKVKAKPILASSPSGGVPRRIPGGYGDHPWTYNDVYDLEFSNDRWSPCRPTYLRVV